VKGIGRHILCPLGSLITPTLLIAADVLSGVGQKGQVPGALDSHSQTSLVLATGTGLMTGLDLATVCQKAAKKLHLLVINNVDPIYAQNTSLAARWCEFPPSPPIRPTFSCSLSICQDYLQI
jgi:hypothetical protein